MFLITKIIGGRKSGVVKRYLEIDKYKREKAVKTKNRIRHFSKSCF
jgi:hypothetical protein